MNKSPQRLIRWRVPGNKNLMAIIFIAGMLMMPEDLLHLLAVVLHTLYESMAFAVEESLVHGFGLSKFQAQIVVFYVSFALGVLGVLAVVRRIPRMLSTVWQCLSECYWKARADILSSWHKLGVRRKIELILLHWVGLFSIMAWVLS